MTLADDVRAAQMGAEEERGGRAMYEAYARAVGTAARWEGLPARLQLGWAAAYRAARESPAGPSVAPGLADGSLRLG